MNHNTSEQLLPEWPPTPPPPTSPSPSPPPCNHQQKKAKTVTSDDNEVMDVEPEQRPRIPTMQPIGAISDDDESTLPHPSFRFKPHLPFLAKNCNVSSHRQLSLSPESNRNHNAMFCVLLSIGTNNKASIASPNTPWWKQRYGKEERTITYKNMFRFGDLGLPVVSTTNSSQARNNPSGDVLTVFQHTNCSTQVFWKFCREPRIGDTFLLRHPSQESKTLLDGNPVIEFDSPFIPATAASGAMLPTIPMNPNPAIDKMQFFVHHSVQLKLKGVFLRSTTCTGFTCDRRLPTAETCACFSSRTNMAGKNKVLKVDGILASPELPYDFPFHDWCSLRFSELILDPIIALHDDAIEDLAFATRITKQTHQCIQHINKHGGWTMIGWQKLGKKNAKNATNKDSTATTASQDIYPHLEYLQPTNPIHLTPDFLAASRIATEHYPGNVDTT